MASTNTTATFSGHTNSGVQLASNSGHVHVNIHPQPDISPTKPNPSSTVPFRRDDEFVDRDILAEVGKKCSKPASRAALVGLGGVGKSQLAIEYSYRIREKSPQTWIFWVHASNAARFEEGYRTIATRIKLPRRDEQTADILRLVSDWLCDEANGQWIMILDNADDPKVFSEPRERRLKSDIGDLGGGVVSLSTFLPQTRNGSILVTSRSEDAASRLTGSHHEIIKVEPMNERHALLLLGIKLRGGFDQSDAIELVRTLDYMPLAISQAAAYIKQRAPRTTVAKYLSDFRKSERNRASLLNRDAGDLRRDGAASNSIITTWQISFEYIRDTRPSAARLLSLMSFFDRQGIPEFLLHYYYDTGDDDKFDLGIEIHYVQNTEVDLEDSNDYMGFEDDVFTLTDYSLISANVKDDQFEMHQLVQLSTRKWLELNGQLEKWKKKFITIICEAFPEGKYENWAIYQMLFPHAEAVLEYRPVEKRYLAKWSQILNNAGWYAAMQGNYSRAEEMNRRALDGSEKALGKEHLDTLKHVSNLATVLWHQGKYETAEKMNRRVLDAREKALGKEHPDTLTSVNNLATVLRDQGKFDAAEEMNRRALDGSEKALGKEHPDTLTSISNLGMVLWDQGKYEAAEEMHRRALDGIEKALGKEHPDTLASVGNLSMVLWDQGKYEAAEEMNRRVLAAREKTLGKEHPDTLTSISNLSMVLSHQGKFVTAEEMNRRVLDARERKLGKEHPKTLRSVHNLAIVFHRQKQYQDAMTFYERACAGSQKELGFYHPATRQCYMDYISMIEEMRASSTSGS